MLVYRITHRRDNQIKEVIEAIGVEPNAVEGLCAKSSYINIMIKSVKTSWANIIKQEMLACGGDAAVSRHSYACKEQFTDVLIMGTRPQIDRFVQKMNMQPVCFKIVADNVEKVLKSFSPAIEIGKMTYDLSKTFVVMGVLNVTPDSFSDGGKYFDYDSAMKRAEDLIASGADIIDIGGESTRPDSVGISEKQEMERVIPVLEAVTKNLGARTSIDSYKPGVVREALKAGAVLVNDISSGTVVASCASEIKKYSASVIAMMNGTKGGLRGFTSDDDDANPDELFVDFCQSSRTKFLELGLKENKMIFDPGIGFGPSINDVSRILRSIGSVTSLGYGVCVGLSRKSYVGKITGLNIDTRDHVCNAISLYLMERGVRIFRTHDPKGLRDVIKAYRSLEGV